MADPIKPCAVITSYLSVQDRSHFTVALVEEAGLLLSFSLPLFSVSCVMLLAVVETTVYDDVT